MIASGDTVMKNPALYTTRAASRSAQLSGFSRWSTCQRSAALSKRILSVELMELIGSKELHMLGGCMGTARLHVNAFSAATGDALSSMAHKTTHQQKARQICAAIDLSDLPRLCPAEKDTVGLLYNLFAEAVTSLLNAR
eukprot:GHUV01037738.1.p1 GENE.GHUV01037738.1~~GHUV01037738.1.p1  ORF type:complete len:139 (+),score=23.62 GHUV01037738.1:540-956(+)